MGHYDSDYEYDALEKDTNLINAKKELLNEIESIRYKCMSNTELLSKRHLGSLEDMRNELLITINGIWNLSQ